MCIRDRYIERILLESRQLTPTLTDRQLIKKISRHFGRDLQLAVITRGITTIPNFEALITEYTNIQPCNENNHRLHYRPIDGERVNSRRGEDFHNKSKTAQKRVWNERTQKNRYDNKQFVNTVNTMEFTGQGASASGAVNDATPRGSTSDNKDVYKRQT